MDVEKQKKIDNICKIAVGLAATIPGDLVAGEAIAIYNEIEKAVEVDDE